MSYYGKYYSIDSVKKNLTVQRFDFLRRKKEFYNISAVESRAYPVYGDVVSGIYTRYFVCRSNLIKIGPVNEIDANQYTSFLSNPNFVTVEIQWRIRGKLEDEIYWINEKEVKNPGVISQNKALIDIAAEKIPAIKSYFYKRDGTLRNPTEYYLGDYSPPAE